MAADPSVERCGPPEHGNIDQVTSEESGDPMLIYYYCLQDKRILADKTTGDNCFHFVEHACAVGGAITNGIKPRLEGDGQRGSGWQLTLNPDEAVETGPSCVLSGPEVSSIRGNKVRQLGRFKPVVSTGASQPAVCWPSGHVCVYPPQSS